MSFSAPEFTVTEISAAIKRTMEDAFCHIKVKGEISGLKVASSGHVYFAIKDAGAVLNCVCWRGNAQTSKVKLEDGLEVVCTGSITTFAGRSVYQMVVTEVQPSGIGALLALFEKRKKKFADAGFFAEERKKALPFLPNKIGVVTSPTGSVIHDILHRITERFPTEVIVWGVLVQGENAAQQVASAIKGFNELPEHIGKPDVIIVARGGGSIEDLWAFNEEEVLHAVINSNIPIISAVGHETDTTLIDFVSDKRAPTPTAAAEIAVPNRLELAHRMQQLSTRNKLAINYHLAKAQANLHNTHKQLQQFAHNIQNMQQKLQHYINQIRIHIENIITHKSNLHSYRRSLPDVINTYINKYVQRVQIVARLLPHYDYHNVLKRGYAILRDQHGHIINNCHTLTTQKNIQVELQDGKAILANMPNKSQH